MSMEVDTGAAISILSQKLQECLLPDAVLKKSYLQMKTYMGEPMSVLDYLEVQAKYGEQEKDLHLFIVSGDGPTLLGRSWLGYFPLDWAKIERITTRDLLHILNTLITNHAAVFEDKRGTISPFEAELHI